MEIKTVYHCTIGITSTPSFIKGHLKKNKKTLSQFMIFPDEIYTENNYLKKAIPSLTECNEVPSNKLNFVETSDKDKLPNHLDGAIDFSH